MSKEEKTNIPPYVPYGTFKNFLDGLKPVPPVIDTAVLKSMSGSLQSQLRSSLRFLGLTDEAGRTQDSLRALAASQGDERKKELRKLLNQAYPFLFKPDDDFSLSEGTSPRFFAKFEKQGASGDSLRKCGKFFLDAATDAGIVISPYIKSKGAAKTKSDNGKAGRVRDTSKGKGAQSRDGGGKYDPTPPVIPTAWNSNLMPALNLLPTNFDKSGKAHWRQSERERFLTVLTAIVDAYAIADEKE